MDQPGDQSEILNDDAQTYDSREVEELNKTNQPVETKLVDSLKPESVVSMPQAVSNYSSKLNQVYLVQTSSTSTQSTHSQNIE